MIIQFTTGATTTRFPFVELRRAREREKRLAGAWFPHNKLSNRLTYGTVRNEDERWEKQSKTQKW